MRLAGMMAIAATAAFGVVAGALALEDRVLEFPADYKTTFTNYMISDRVQNEEQVISLFANSVARDAARKGETMPDGSIILGEIYAARKDADGAVIESPLGRRIPDKLLAIVVMERRAAWADQYPEETKLAGWEFEVFSPAGENLGKDTAACRECHAPLSDTDFTWSAVHIGAAN